MPITLLFYQIYSGGCVNIYSLGPFIAARASLGAYLVALHGAACAAETLKGSLLDHVALANKCLAAMEKLEEIAAK